MMRDTQRGMEVVSFSADSLQIGQNQSRQVVAVTAFEQAEHRHAHFAQLAAEPVEILRFERTLRQRVAGVGVEASRDADKIRLEFFQIMERVLQDFAVIPAWGVWRDGIVETIVTHMPRAGAGIARKFVNRVKRHARVVQQNILRAVAVMHVEIKHRDAFGAGRLGGERGDGGVAQIAEAHHLIARGVMAGRTHQAENSFPGLRAFEREQRRPGGKPGERFNVRKKRGVGVEIVGHPQAGEVLGQVGPQEVRLRRGRRLGPRQGEIGLLAEPGKRGGDARGPIGMAGRGVAGATLISDDFHGRNSTTDGLGWTRIFSRSAAFEFCYSGSSLYSAARQIMPVMKTKFLRFVLLAAAALALALPARAWDYEGHRVVNQLALASLPTNFPAFVLTPEGRERIAFLAGEPDRWRNISDDLALSHYSGPDHYLDLEELEDYELTPATAPPFRYDLVTKLALERAAHPEKFPAPDPAKNKDHTRELTGFAPWAITENCGKLRSGFSYLRAYQNHGGTPEEIANAQANILYIMGTMGHYVGDCAQPLHVTKHHHGWVGDNPKGYATNFSFHAWIDGGFLRKTGGVNAAALTGKIRPAKIVGDPLKPGDLFRQVMAYLETTHTQVEPLYQLEKEQKLTPENAQASEGRAFLEGQLVKGGQMLGDLWFSAWQQATEDKYLIGQLTARQAAQAEKNGEKK